MSHHARLVLLYHNEGVILAGKVHFHAVDPHNTHLAAAQRLSPHRHHPTGGVFHPDIYRIGVDVCLRFIGGEAVGQTPLGGNRKGLPDAGVIGGKSHHAAQQSAIRAVAVVGLGKGAV